MRDNCSSSFAIFGHDANPAYPKEGYETIIEVCQQAYSLLGVEKRFSADRDAYPYLNTVTWLMERVADGLVSPRQVTPPEELGFRISDFGFLVCLTSSEFKKGINSAFRIPNSEFRAGGISMRSERGYDQTEFYQTKGVDVEPALAQSNELIHSPWSYLKYRAALVASKLPNEFASIQAWEEFRESYLWAHAQFMGLEYLYKVKHPPMNSVVLDVNENYSIPDFGGPVVREEILYHFDHGFYIPALVFRPKKAEGKLPSVVLTPGWFQPKDEATFLKLGVALANDGFVAICSQGSPTPKAFGMDRIENLGATPNSINTFSLAFGSCLEGLSGARIVRALDYLVTRDDVDAERIGIAGLCSGSITMWSGVPIEPRFKAIVHVSGTTNQESWSMDFNYAGDMETAFPSILKHGDIQHIYASYAPKPFLFITNRTDNWWPQPGLRRCVEVTSKVYELYGARDKFDYRLFNATHTVDEPFRKWIVYWFKKWLQSSNPPQPPEVGRILE